MLLALGFIGVFLFGMVCGAATVMPDHKDSTYIEPLPKTFLEDQKPKRDVSHLKNHIINNRGQ